MAADATPPLDTASSRTKPTAAADGEKGMKSLGAEHRSESADKWHGPRQFLFFAVIVLGLLGLNWILSQRTFIQNKLELNTMQLFFAMISIEICLALYLFGVGWLSPHWRPYPPQPKDDDTKSSTSITGGGA